MASPAIKASVAAVDPVATAVATESTAPLEELDAAAAAAPSLKSRAGPTVEPVTATPVPIDTPRPVTVAAVAAVDPATVDDEVVAIRVAAAPAPKRAAVVTAPPLAEVLDADDKVAAAPVPPSAAVVTCGRCSSPNACGS